MATISSHETGQTVASTVADLATLARNSTDEQVSKAGSATAVDDTPHQKPDEKKVREAAAKISDFIESFTRDLEFSVDNDTRKIVIKVKVRDSGEVVRQIPSEEALKIADSLDTLRGLLIREQA